MRLETSLEDFNLSEQYCVSSKVKLESATTWAIRPTTSDDAHLIVLLACPIYGYTKDIILYITDQQHIITSSYYMLYYSGYTITNCCEIIFSSSQPFPSFLPRLHSTPDVSFRIFFIAHNTPQNIFTSTASFRLYFVTFRPVHKWQAHIHWWLK